MGGRPGTGGAGTGSTLVPDGMEMPDALAVLTAAEAACKDHDHPLASVCRASAGHVSLGCFERMWLPEETRELCDGCCHLEGL